MILSNVEIINLIKTGELRIDPFSDRLVRPASVCLRLGGSCLFLEANGEIDVRDKRTFPRYRSITATAAGIVIPARRLVLVNTLETISLSRRVAGWVENLSGLARLGLQVVLSNYITPGYGENGPSTLTLELFNTLDVPIRIYPEMRVCHLVLAMLAVPADSGYDKQVGTYSRQTDARESHFFNEFTGA